MSNIIKQQMQQEMSEITPIFLQWGYESPVLIGQGAFSRVYRVRNITTGRFLACKVSNEKEMLRRESSLLQQIVHPLFTAFYDFRQQGNLCFLFMEYVPGASLEKILAGRGRMSERQTVRISMKLAEGLCYLHEQSTPILFRDLKPENIIIREDGEVKLLDLGSACPMDTSMYVITGTHGYAAPEQWRKQGNVGFHSDVYALGQVMSHMLGDRKTGRVYRGISHLVAECTREEVAERIPNMRILLHRLNPYAKEDKKVILCLEIKARLCGRKQNKYIFQKNILKF